MIQRTIVNLIILIPSLILSTQLEVAEGDKKIVTAGYGETPETALKDAFRNAVEEAVGLFCQSTTMTENQELLEDKIYTYSNGFIKNYKNLGTLKTEDGFFQTNIVAIITKNQVREAISGAGVSIDIEEQAGLLFAQYSSEKKRIEDEEKAVKVFFNNLYMDDLFNYSSNLIGVYEYQDKSSGQKQAVQDKKLVLQVIHVETNDNYKNLYSTINKFLLEIADKVVEGDFYFDKNLSSSLSSVGFYALDLPNQSEIKNKLVNQENKTESGNLFFLLDTLYDNHPKIEEINKELSQNKNLSKKEKKKRDKALNKEIKNLNSDWRIFSPRKFFSKHQKPLYTRGKLLKFASGNTSNLLATFLNDLPLKIGFQVQFKDSKGEVLHSFYHSNYKWSLLESHKNPKGNWLQKNGVFSFLNKLEPVSWIYDKSSNPKERDIKIISLKDRESKEHISFNLINSRLLNFPFLKGFNKGYNEKDYRGEPVFKPWQPSYFKDDSKYSKINFNLNFFLHPDLFSIDYDKYIKWVSEIPKESKYEGTFATQKNKNIILDNDDLRNSFLNIKKPKNSISLFGVGHNLPLETFSKLAKIDILPVYEGAIGIFLELGEDQYRSGQHVNFVKQILPGSPAEKAGLLPGDMIYSRRKAGINNPENRGIPFRIIDQLKGPAGGSVEITVQRKEGWQYINKKFTVVREKLTSFKRK